MACGICGEVETLYMVKKVPMCEDCYQHFLGLRYRELEELEWFMNVLGSGKCDESAKALIEQTIAEKGLDAPTVPISMINEEQAQNKRKSVILSRLKEFWDNFF